MDQRYYAMQFVEINHATNFTDVQRKNYLKLASKFDVFPIEAACWAYADHTGDPAEEIKKRNPLCETLLWINMSFIGLDGVGSLAYGGDPTLPYEDAKPYHFIKYWMSKRCWDNPEQYLYSDSGTVIYDSTYPTKYQICFDIGKNCPRATDGLTYREWLVDYLVTGVAKKFDHIDGFMFDEYHSNNSNAWIYGDVDINRDGVAETNNELISYWQDGMQKFAYELRAKLDAIGLTGFKIWSNGNFSGDYTPFDGWTYEYWPDGFMGNNWEEASGRIQSYLDQGAKVAINNWTDGSNTTITSMYPGNSTLFRTHRYAVGTAHLFDGVMMCSDSGSSLHNAIWYHDELMPRFYNPMHEMRSTGSMYYRRFENGLVVVNTGSSSTLFNGNALAGQDGLLVYAETDYDYLHGTRALQHGFFGIKGTGEGNHLNHPDEKITLELMNKLERAVEMISKMPKKGQGPFKFQSSGTLTYQHFEGDGVTKKFSFQKGIDKWRLEGYNITGGYPHPYMNLLTDKNEYTNLYHAIEFDEPPTSGEDIFIFYKRGFGSVVNSNAYIGS